MVAVEAGLVGALILGVLALVGTVTTGALAYLQSRRTTEATKEVGIIEAAQLVQDQTIKNQAAEIVELRREIRTVKAESNTEIAALKAEIHMLEAEIDRLRRESR